MLDDLDPAPTDGTVVLRRWTMDDLGCVRAAGEEGRIHEGTSVPQWFTEEAGRAWIRRQQGRTRAGQGWSLAIGDARTGEAFGCVVLLLRPQTGVAGIGYWLVPEARNRGYATRAVGLLADRGLEAGGLDRIEAWVEPGNEASVRVLSRCGFEHEGRLRSFLRSKASARRVGMFSRIQEPPHAFPEA